MIFNDLIQIFYFILSIALPIQVFSTCLSKEEQVKWSRQIFPHGTPLVIESTNRASHKIISHIILILIKERLGYRNVTITEHKWDNVTNVINRLSPNQRSINKVTDKKSDLLPESHINMEVWMPAGFTSGEWVSKGFIIDCGPLGSWARTGIFFNNLNVSQDNWRDVLRQSSINSKMQPLLDTFEINRFGRILKKSRGSFDWCETHFITDKDLPRQYLGILNNIFDNWTISESGPLNSNASLIFSWYPNMLTIQNTVSRILFPDSYEYFPFVTDESDGHINQLTKVVWNGIKSRAPLIFKLIDSFHLTNYDLEQLINKVRIDNNISLDNQYYKIACDWVKNNKLIWEPLTNGWNTTKNLTILVLTSEGKYSLSNDEKIVFKHGLRLLNTDERLSQFRFLIKYIDMKHDEDEMLTEYLKEFSTNDQTIVGILTALPTEYVIPVYRLALVQQKIIISYSQELRPLLLNYANNPLIFQTAPYQSLYLTVLEYFAKQYGWSQNILLTDKAEVNPQDLPNDFILKNLATLNDQEIYDTLKQLKQNMNARIFMVDVSGTKLFALLCAAGNLDMVLEPHRYVWILMSGPALLSIPYPYLACIRQIRKIIKNHFYLSVYNQSFVVPCKNFRQDNVYRALMALGQSTIKLLQKEQPQNNYINSTLLAEYINRDKSDSIFCNNKIYNSDPISFSQNAVLWDTWFLYQENNDKYYQSVEFKLARKYVLSDPERISTMKKRKKIYWGANNAPHPVDGKNEQNQICWLELIASNLSVTCLSAELIFLSALVLLIFMAIAIISTFIYFKKIKVKNNPQELIFRSLVQDLLEVDIPSSQLLLNHVIGQGAFGMVYGGEARTSMGHLQAVAVKVISEDSDWLEKINFLTEAKVMLKLDHVNIVELLGVCLDYKNGVILLVMELMVEGDLRNYLLSRRSLAAAYPEESKEGRQLSVNLTNFAKDIASALKYMHSKMMIHRDVACRNCLLSHDLTVKLADFGLTIHESHLNLSSRKSQQMTLPIRWLPPEALQFASFSDKSDIWSYGILLFEIATFGMCPYQDFCSDYQLELVEKIKRNQISITQYLPQSSCGTSTYTLISQCCSYVPKDRPDNMEKILLELNANETCIKPYLTEDPPKSEIKKKFKSLNELRPLVVENDCEAVQITSPTPDSSSQRALNRLNRAAQRFRTSGHGLSLNFSPNKDQSPFRISQSSTSICDRDVIGKKSNTFFVQSIPFDLCENKSRSLNPFLTNFFRISPKASSNKLKHNIKDLH